MTFLYSKINLHKDKLYKHCDIDSSAMGILVARIIPSVLSSEELYELLQYLKSQKISLVYWAADSRSADECDISINRSNGFICAVNATFSMQLKHESMNYLGLPPGIKFYDDKKSNTDLESLAVKCSSHSHLRNDPNITDEHISKIYTQWLRNSIHGADSGNVLVALVDNEIIGMTTYSFHAMGGRINLLSVSSDMIRKGWGLKLVKSVQSVLINRCLTLDVITQSSNIAARMLYEKCGFKITQLYNIFHFWL